MFNSIDDVEAALSAQHYLPDRALATSVFLAESLSQPLLLEGEAGVGKTEVAKALAHATGARLIRLQCHEGIDLHQALYDWDYQRQLLAIRAAEARDGADVPEGRLFSRDFLLKRPLLEALEEEGPVVLLIDEIDRADDEFELRVCEAVARLRGEELYKLPGVGETINWARALLALGGDDLDEALGVALKVREDIQRVRELGVLEGV